MSDIETIFIRKFTEKFTLNERGLKKAFSRFVTNENGQLGIDEIENFFKLFLNGFDANDIKQFVLKYDLNGDGQISYLELLDLLKGKKSKKKQNQNVSNDLDATKGSVQIEKSFNKPLKDNETENMTKINRDIERIRLSKSSESSDDIQVNNTDSIDNLVQEYIRNLKSYLMKLCSSRIQDREKKGASGLTQTAPQHTATLVKELLDKEFQPYTGLGDGRVRHTLGTGVTFNDFSKVLRRLKVPGTTLSQALLERLFALCESKEVPGTLDPQNLINVIFDSSTLTRTTSSNILLPSANTTIVPTISGAMTTVITPAVTPSESLLLQSPSFVRGKSRTSLAPPSNLSIIDIKQSQQLPLYECVREHVFGLTTTLQAGSSILSLPLLPASYTGRGSSTTSTVSNNRTGCSIVYAAGPLGIVHDFGSNSQRFFNGHRDDVTCIDLSKDGTIAATGCVRSVGDRDSARVLIWNTALRSSGSSDSQDGLIVAVGTGFFERAVGALKFSPDSKYLCAVGCDDNHRLGIWALNLSSTRPAVQLVTEVNSLHGLPTDFRWLDWAPGQHTTSFISRDHSIPCDMLCTAGERHLRLWSFMRPQGTTVSSDPSATPSLVYKACVIPQNKPTKLASASKLYTTCIFVPCEDGTYDMVSGGSNGVVYLWRRGECVVSCNAIKGGVRCLTAHDDMLFCGGFGSVVKVLDSRTLKVVLGFSLLSLGLVRSLTSVASAREDLPSRPSSKASTGVSSQRPSSASRPSTTASSSRRTSVSSIPTTPSRSSSISRLRPTSSISTFASRNMTTLPSPIRSPAPAGIKSFPDPKPSPLYGGEEDPAQEVTGLTVVAVPGTSGMSQNASLISLYLVATTSSGRAVRIDVGRALVSERQKSVKDIGPLQLMQSHMYTLFHYHIGTLHGLCASPNIDGIGPVLVTSGDDRRICVWSTHNKSIITRLVTKVSAMCVSLDHTGTFVAAGLASGGLSVMALVQLPSDLGRSPRRRENVDTGDRLFGKRDTINAVISEFSHVLREVAFRKDAKESASDVKFSPDNNMLALASHDNYIYLYSCALESDTFLNRFECVLRPLHRLSGHSSFVTHIDWSVDNQLLQSTCGAYELLCWEAQSGKPYSVMPNANIKWDSMHCTLSYCLLGIWAPYSNGSDINAVDVSTQLGVCVTAEDTGAMHLLSYPCVVKHAPRKTYDAHSSHVTNVRIFQLDDGKAYVASVGGRDATVALWKLNSVPKVAPLKDYTNVL